jgi:hypothetical protein
MERIFKTLLLFSVLGIATATLPIFGSTQDLCFTNGSVTYQLAPGASAPDFRVRIDNGAPQPDLRVRLVDHADLADFSLVDDVGAPARDTCATAGDLRTVKIVKPGDKGDMTINVGREVHQADFTLFVHSTRVTHYDAAALFALVQHVQANQKLAAYR